MMDRYSGRSRGFAFVTFTVSLLPPRKPLSLMQSAAPTTRQDNIDFSTRARARRALQNICCYPPPKGRISPAPKSWEPGADADQRRLRRFPREAREAPAGRSAAAPLRSRHRIFDGRASIPPTPAARRQDAACAAAARDALNGQVRRRRLPSSISPPSSHRNCVVARASHLTRRPARRSSTGAQSRSTTPDSAPTPPAAAAAAAAATAAAWSERASGAVAREQAPCRPGCRGEDLGRSGRRIFRADDSMGGAARGRRRTMYGCRRRRG